MVKKLLLIAALLVLLVGCAAPTPTPFSPGTSETPATTRDRLSTFMRDPQMPIFIGIMAGVLLLLTGLTVWSIRDKRAEKRKFHVKAKIFVGYDEEAALSWDKEFSHRGPDSMWDRYRRPHLAAFYEAFDPSVLTQDEARAETIVKLAYTSEVTKRYINEAGYPVSGGLSICCEVTVSSRASQKVIMRVPVCGTPPPDRITYRQGDYPGAAYGGMPEVGHIVGFLRRLIVEPAPTGVRRKRVRRRRTLVP